MFLKINPGNPDKKVIKKIAGAIKKGGVAVFPTDTVYGLLADARNKKAVGKIFKIKKRPKTKPLAIFAKDIKMAKKYAFIGGKPEKFLKRNWPGKITAVLKAKGSLAEGLAAKNKTIGVRISGYKLIGLLFKKIDFPLAQTSANISGREATVKIGEVAGQFARRKIKPDLIADAGDLPQNRPSKVIDFTGEKPRILRF